MNMQKAGKALLVLALSAVLPALVQAQAKDPVQIGIVTSQSGNFTAQGEDSLRGMQFAIDEANAAGGVAGRPVKFQVGDDESTPEGGRRVAEKFARSGYNLLVGPISSAITLALAQNLQRWDALYVSTLSKSDRITGDSCNPRMFQANHSDAMDLAIVQPWLKENSKETRFAIIANDYVWGRDSAESFTKAADKLGKKVELSIFPPVGTKDFAPYIAQLKSSGAQAVWVALVGRDLIAFAKQAAEFGLTSSTRIIGHSYIMSFVIKATDNATEGVWGVMNYSPDIDTPRNKAFVAAWRKKFSREPAENEVAGYNGVQLILQGVQKADSVKPIDISKALAGQTVDTVWGTAKVRAEDHQLVKANYMGRVKRVNGQLRAVIENSFDPAIATPAPSAVCKY
jgi:branched-chain amino acid transport system substrate-binding protein